jgi:hypothetical protein
VTEVLLAAVLLLTALSLLNLVLLLGVVRRLREHESRLAAAELAGMAGEGPAELIAPVGSRVAEFSARTVDGRSLDKEALATPALVGFFSPGCDSCHERLPDFRRAAADNAGRALAVVVRDGADVDPLVGELERVASVVVEDPDGPLTSAFGVRGFPVFALVGTGGTIEARGYQLPLQPV